MSDKANPSTIASANELDARVKRVDEDRWLSSRYASAQCRKGLIAVYAFHYELVRALHMSEPMLGRIRVQWWRDAVAEIAQGAPLRAHDVVQALAETLQARAKAIEVAGQLMDAFDARIDAEPETKGGGAPPLVTAGGCVALLSGSVLTVDGALEDAQAEALVTCGEAFAAAQMGELDAADRLAQARMAFSAISTELMPAIAHLALAQTEATVRKRSALSRRWRVLKTVATGKLP